MQRIGFVVLPDFQVMSLAALSVFEFANMSAGEPLYEIQVSVRTWRPRDELVRHARRNEGLWRSGVRHAHHWRGHREGSHHAGPHRLRASRARSVTPDRVDLHGRIRARRGRPARRPARHHALAHGARASAATFPKVKVEDDRIFIIDGADLDLGGHERGDRSGAGHGREGFRRRAGALGRAEAGASITAARAVSRSTRRCWKWMPSPTASRARSTTPGRTCARRFRSRNWPRPRI